MTTKLSPSAIETLSEQLANDLSADLTNIEKEINEFILQKQKALTDKYDNLEVIMLYNPDGSGYVLKGIITIR